MSSSCESAYLGRFSGSAGYGGDTKYSCCSSQARSECSCIGCVKKGVKKGKQGLLPRCLL